MNATAILQSVVSSIIFSAIGLVMFLIAFKAIQWLSPFSIRKELEEDQNTAVGIVMGAVMLGLAIIIAAAIHG